ncbi:MAG: hypothetical protein ACLP4R_12925 [Solirubrobacteraceae bacterium]
MSGRFPPESLPSLIFTTQQRDPIQTGPLFTTLRPAPAAYDNATTKTTTVFHVDGSATNWDGAKVTSNLACGLSACG